MREFKGKTVLITGGAGGLGMGFARLAAERQMNVVLADIQADALDQAVAELEGRQCPVLAVLTDTRQRDQYENLLESARSRFGNIHLFFNNAGVVNGGKPVPVWDLPDADWAWVMGVNFYGVLNGLQTENSIRRSLEPFTWKPKYPSPNPLAIKNDPIGSSPLGTVTSV